MVTETHNRGCIIVYESILGKEKHYEQARQLVHIKHFTCFQYIFNQTLRDVIKNYLPFDTFMTLCQMEGRIECI